MEIGIIKPVRIEDEMRSSYLDFAMSVITARALPDVRDGLKPVQRRILYAMEEMGLRHTSPHKKSARIVGEVMGKYHPHGDAPVYEAMVRLAQDFSMRYPLVDGQGNFGSVDGDPPAAMRYTEARLTPLAEEILADIDKDTVDFTPNFDDSLKEPLPLPGKLPNLLVNGSVGIAVGMMTSIPPHNLSEVVAALTHIIGRLAQAMESGFPFDLVWARLFNETPEAAQLITALDSLPKETAARVHAETHQKNPSKEACAQVLLSLLDSMVDVGPDSLMEIVQGPDFPTRGIILGQEGIKAAYSTGHGRAILRARTHVEETRGNRSQIIVTELPYQISKAGLLEKIADLVRDRRIEGISELRDESDREGMRIVIELKREAQPRQVLNQLLKHTAMQSTFTINMLALVDGQPRLLTLKMLLLHFLSHRRNALSRRTAFELERARQRAHILEGLKIALDHLDEVIATIRSSPNADTARNSLMKKFKFTEAQAQAILDMQLRRLAALEQRRILEELAETRQQVAYLEDLLAHPKKILSVIKDELQELKTKYGDSRRTRITAEEQEEFTEEDLIPDLEVAIVLNDRGYIKRLPVDSYLDKSGRGVKGSSSTLTREQDGIRHLVVARTHDEVVFFTERGRVFKMKAHEVPDGLRQARGVPLSTLISLDGQERVADMVAVDTSEHFILVTREGEVKRVAASEYASARATGLIGMSVAEGDELVGAEAVREGQEIIIVTQKGQAIRFSVDEVRASGRTSGGVKAIRLAGQDRVVDFDVVEPEGELMLVTAKGYGKRTQLSEFATQSRGGSGIRAISLTARSGDVVAARVVGPGDELLVISSDGLVLHAPLGEVPLKGRTTVGAVLLHRRSLLAPRRPKKVGRPPIQRNDQEPQPMSRVEPGRQAVTKAPVVETLAKLRKERKPWIAQHGQG